jgi:hypothetical protein
MRSASWSPTRAAIAVLMAAETATLLVASLLHFGVVIGGVHDPFSGAAVPEAVIAAVLATGLLTLLLRPSTAWRAPLAATVLAIVGFLVGVRFTVLGGGPLRTGDIAYHVAGLCLLVITVGLLLRDRTDRV